jgi:hypothetical protein
MPIHAWNRVSAGIFHDFHQAWIAEIRNALNESVLPSDYYALIEPVAGHLEPDVLALQALGDGDEDGAPLSPGSGLTTVALVPPRVRFTATTEMDEYVLKQKTLVIRHSGGDRVVALVEIVSPGNKASRHALRAFLNKATEALYRGYHLLIADLHPPSRRDPQGIHGALWAEISDESFQAPADKPLTLASYSAAQLKRAYVEPVSVGDVLPDMPLFLEPEAYVSVPLEKTYQAAYRGVPRRWRGVLEAPAP